jgi:hypothetical protein
MSQLDSTERGFSPPETPPHGFLAWIGGIWCRLFHRRVMLPIHGYYQCRRCFRRIPISFELSDSGDSSNPRGRR